MPPIRAKGKMIGPVSLPPRRGLEALRAAAAPAGVGRGPRPRPFEAILGLAARLPPPLKPAAPGQPAIEPLGMEDFLRELALLGLDGHYFDWDLYRARLAAALRIEILVSFVPDDGDPVLRMRLMQAGWPGCVYRDEKTADALVLVSSSLDVLGARLVLFHEFGHIAGGHPLRIEDVRRAPGQGPDEDRGWWDPPRSLLGGRVAPRDEEWCESDANRRAELAIQAGLYGYDRYRRDEWFFGVG